MAGGDIYSEEEDAFLRANYRKPLTELSKVLHRGERAIAVRIAKLGLSRKRVFWTPERDAELIRLFDDGWSDPRLTSHFGLSDKAVLKRRNDLGLIRDVYRARSLTDEQRDQLRQMRRTGMGYVRMAQAIGMPEPVVRRALEALMDEEGDAAQAEIVARREDKFLRALIKDGGMPRFSERNGRICLPLVRDFDLKRSAA
jgi:hypothetical protein